MSVIICVDVHNDVVVLFAYLQELPLTLLCTTTAHVFRTIEDSQLYNSLKNATYFDMITDNPLLGPSGRRGVCCFDYLFFISFHFLSWHHVYHHIK